MALAEEASLALEVSLFPPIFGESKSGKELQIGHYFTSLCISSILVLAKSYSGGEYYEIFKMAAYIYTNILYG